MTPDVPIGVPDADAAVTEIDSADVLPDAPDAELPPLDADAASAVDTLDTSKVPDTTPPDATKAPDATPPDTSDVALMPPLDCPQDPTAAAMLPGDPSPPAGCWSWIRTGAAPESERKDGKIAVYAPLPEQASVTQERHVYGADGALLAADMAAPVTEFLAPLGNGYTTVTPLPLMDWQNPDVFQVIRHDANDQIQWLKDMPSGSAIVMGQLCFNYSVVPEFMATTPAGNFVVVGRDNYVFPPWNANEMCAGEAQYAGYVVFAADGLLLLDKSGAFGSSTLDYPEVSSVRVVGDGVGISDTIWPGTYWSYRVTHIRDGAIAKPDVFVLPDVAYPQPNIDPVLFDFWPNGDLLVFGSGWGSYTSKKSGVIARYVLGAAKDPPVWSIAVYCDLAAVRPDGSVIGYGGLGADRGWFQVDADGKNLVKLPFPAKYVPTILHPSVSGGMYMAGNIEQAGKVTGQWFGRSPLAACQPFACAAY